ncbi:MAG: hypothetical protein EPO24_11250, partial [Bacteroidetes bacterium]
MKSRLKSFLLISLIALTVVAGFQLFTYYSSPIISDKPVLSASLREELIALAKKSLHSGDAPVSALILYQGKIIGK